jgi:hypothetical protein
MIVRWSHACRSIALLAMLLSTAGAAFADSSRLAWGRYEELIFAGYVKPGSLDPQADVKVLEKDRQAAKSAGKPLPPGWHAHLGMMYFRAGRSDTARRELEAEKEAFPESAVLVDRLLANVSSGAGAANPAPAVPAPQVPRSILVLPPINETAEVEATASFLSTVSRPVVERGYYVFPVAVIDRLMQENGLPTAGEMHQVPPQKLREVTGADAILYPVIEDYGNKYFVVGTGTRTQVRAKLVDASTGELLWESTGESDSGGVSGPVDPITAGIGTALLDAVAGKRKPARQTTRLANESLVTGKSRGLVSTRRGESLPVGPYYREFAPRR